MATSSFSKTFVFNSEAVKKVQSVQKQSGTKVPSPVTDRVKEGKEALALIELKNYDCILWDKECGCKAYGARPVQCSTYPFWSWILKDKDSWNNESKSCPGINKGKIWSKESIEKECSNYVANVPITR